MESLASLKEVVSCAYDGDAILCQGEFNLGEWNSNCSKTLDAIINREKSVTEIELGDSNVTVLSLYWRPLNDELLFKVRIVESPTLRTKRNILSDVARLCESICTLVPVLILAKMFI